jgi:hypothetical protein
MTPELKAPLSANGSAGYNTLRGVALRRWRQGDLLGALAAYCYAIELAERRRDTQWRGVLLGEMADLYSQEGAPELTQPLCWEAVACLGGCGDRAKLSIRPVHRICQRVRVRLCGI